MIRNLSIGVGNEFYVRVLWNEIHDALFFIPLSMSYGPWTIPIIFPGIPTPGDSILYFILFPFYPPLKSTEGGVC